MTKELYDNLSASTYNEVLTIIVNYYNSDINQELIQNFLEYMLENLESVN